MVVFYRCLVIIFVGGLSFDLGAQCGVTVDAGPDATVCAADLPFVLTGSVSNEREFLSADWEPAAAVSNPEALTTTFVGPSTTTLTLTAAVIDLSTNLLQNADFEAGDMSFTTEYDPGMGGTFGTLSLEGTYAISDNARNTHSNFAACRDHSGTGQMMVVNGATAPNEQIYCQVVAVDPNTKYALRAWVQSVISDNPARLQFSVNGVLVGPTFRAASATCNWQQFDDRWDSGAATTAEVCIVNQNTQSSGNDFALDDLFFGPVCEQTDEITITVVETEIVLAATTTLPCSPPSGGFRLDATGSSSGTDYTYQWTTDNGNIVSGGTTLRPVIDLPGNYTFMVTYDDGITVCTEQQTILVRPDPNQPRARATVTDGITCSRPQVIISGNGSTTGSNITYIWTTEDGNIVGASNRINITVDEPGTYNLVVLTSAGCSAETSVEVTADNTPPVIVVAPVEEIDCSVPSVSIDATASDSGPGLAGSWTTADGQIVSISSNGYVLEAGRAGTYEFRLQNNDNGCFTTESVSVRGAPSDIMVTINDSGSLDCRGGTIELTGMAMGAGTGITYEWTTDDGTLSGPLDQTTTTATSPGIYVLTVSDDSGCSNMAFTQVTAPAFDVDILLSAPEPFTCDRAQIQLEADVMTTEAVDYAWTTMDGTIVSEETGPNPTISAPGTYLLTVTNRDNGCVASEMITVEPVSGLPVAMAAVSGTLTCDNASVFLDAAGSSSGSEFDTYYEDEAGERLPSLAVMEGGVYTLVVVNTDNDCVATDQVTVVVDTLTPLAPIIAPGTTLTCDVTQIAIGTDQTSSGYTFEWEGPRDGFTGDPAAADILVEGPGTFTLTARDPFNGCASTSSIEIFSDNEPPIISLAAPSDLTCADPTQVLQGTLDNPDGFVISWTTDGNIVSGATTLTPTINTAGTYRLVANNAATGCADSLSVDVAQIAEPPLANAGEDFQLNCTAPEGMLNGVGSTGGSAITYLWSGPEESSIDAPGELTPSISLPGRYFILVRNEDNGCEAVDSVDVTADFMAPEVNLALPQVLTCVDSVVSLRAGGIPDANWEYTWTTADGELPPDRTMPSIEVRNSGSYTLTIRDPSNGCSADNTVTVMEDKRAPAASISSSGTIDCVNATAQLSGAGSTTELSTIFRWTTENGNILGPIGEEVVGVDLAGTYQLAVTYSENGCSASTTIEVRVDTLRPRVDLEAPGLLTCRETEIELRTVDESREPTYRYSWSRAEGPLDGTIDEPTLTTDLNGTYSLLIVDETNGCEQILTAQVRQDTVSPVIERLLPDTLTCTIDTLSTTAVVARNRPDMTYSWTTDVGNIVGPDDGLTVNVDATGQYTIRVLDEDSGCSQTRTWSVAESRDLPTFALPTEVDLGCNPVPTIIAAEFATGDYGFLWSTTTGNIVGIRDSSVVTIDGAGSYQLLVTDLESGCGASSAVEARLNELEGFAVRVDSADCNRAEATLSFGQVDGGEGPYLFSTDGGVSFAPGSEPRPLSPGNYQLRVQDSRGCEATDSIAIPPVRLLELVLSDPTTIAIGDSIQLSLSVFNTSAVLDTIIWSPSFSLSCGDCFTPVAKPFRTTTYEVLVRTEDGCFATEQVRVVVDERLSVYFPTGFSPNNDGVNDRFLPFGDLTKIVSISEFQVYDRWGNQVFEADRIVPNNILEGWDGEARGQPANSGVFVYSAIVEFISGQSVLFEGEVTLMR